MIRMQKVKLYHISSCTYSVLALNLIDGIVKFNKNVIYEM
jgi:hypothetical protein